MSTIAHLYLIAYDIADDRRRDRVAKELLHYGERLQASVFCVRATQSKIVRLTADLGSTIKRAEDSLLICDLGVAGAEITGKVTTLGRSLTFPTDGALVI